MAEHPFANLRFTARTHVGRKRTGNEDAYLTLPEYGVFCVADGMGGAEQGEVASRAAVEALERVVRAHPASRPESCQARGDVVQDAMNEASRWILNHARTNNLRSMGTTAIVLAFDGLRPDRALGLHAGDSRLYSFREGALTQISRDHSLAEAAGVKDESQLAPAFRSVITRSVGIHETVKLDRTPVSVHPGDWFLLCSDGLTRMLADEAIAAILGEGRGSNLGAVADRLIEAANKAGGRDNITVILVRVGTDSETEPEDSGTAVGADAPATMELRPTPAESATAEKAASEDEEGMTRALAGDVPESGALRARAARGDDDAEPIRERRGVSLSRQSQLLLGGIVLLLLAVGTILVWNRLGRQAPSHRPARPGDLTWDGRATAGDGTEDILDQGTAEEPFEGRLRAALSTGDLGDLRRWTQAALDRRDVLSRKALPMKPPWLDAWRLTRTPAEKVKLLIADPVREACYLAWLAEWDTARAGGLSPVGVLRDRRERMRAALPGVALDDLGLGFPPGETPEARATAYCRQARRDQRVFLDGLRDFAVGVRSRNEPLWQDVTLLEAPTALGLVARTDSLKEVAEAVVTLRARADELESLTRRMGEWPTVEAGSRPDDLTLALAKECGGIEKTLWDRLQETVAAWRLDPKVWTQWGDEDMARMLEVVRRNLELLRERDPAKALDVEAVRKTTVEALTALVDVHQRLTRRMVGLKIEDAGLALQLGLRNPTPEQVMANTEWALFGVSAVSNTLSLAALKAYAQFLRECPESPMLTNRMARLSGAILTQAESVLRAWVAPPQLAADQARELAGFLPPLRDAWGPVLDTCAALKRGPPSSAVALRDLMPRTVAVVWPRPSVQYPWIEYARALARLKNALAAASGPPAVGLDRETYRARWESWLSAPRSRVSVRGAWTGGQPRWPACVAESVGAGERILVLGATLDHGGDETEVRQAWGSTLTYTVINATGRREEKSLVLDPPQPGGVTGLVALATWPWSEARTRIETWRGFLADALRVALRTAVRDQAARDLLALLRNQGDARGLRDACDLEDDWTGFGGAADVQRLVAALEQLGQSEPLFEASTAGRVEHGKGCSALRIRSEALWKEVERIRDPLRTEVSAVAKSAIENRTAAHLDALFGQFGKFPASERAYLVSDAIEMLAGVDALTDSITRGGADSILGRRLLRFADDAFFQVNVLCASTVPAAQTIRRWAWMQQAVDGARARQIARNRSQPGEPRRH